jgi:hypothetical protein
MDVGDDGYGGFPRVLNYVPLRTSLALSSQSKTIVATIAITVKVTVHALARRQVEL